MLFKRLKDRLVEETERVYDATKNKNYDVRLSVAPHMEKKISKKRNTKDTIKWRSRIH